MLDNITTFLLSEKFLKPIFIIIFAMIIYRIIKGFIVKGFTKKNNDYDSKRRITIANLFTNVLKICIYAISIIMILNIYGVDTNGIIASLGIASVILGLSLQNTVQDLMSGINIITENYYVIGDYIIINGFTGKVIDFSLRSTKIRGLTGETLIFANRNVSVINNLSQTDAGIKIDIPTAYEHESNNVERVIDNIIKQIKDIYGVKDVEYLGIDSLDESCVSYSILIHVIPDLQWKVKRMSLKIIKDTYDKENIKIPYNQIEVHNGKEIL